MRRRDLGTRYFTPRSYYFRVREYFIILGGIARAKRSVPKLEIVFCPRHHDLLSGEAAVRPHLKMFQETDRSRGRDTMRNVVETQIFERHVGVAAARGPPFFRDSLARPLLHARPVLYSFLSCLYTVSHIDRKLLSHI